MTKWFIHYYIKIRTYITKLTLKKQVKIKKKKTRTKRNSQNSSPTVKDVKSKTPDSPTKLPASVSLENHSIPTPILQSEIYQPQISQTITKPTKQIKRLGYMNTIIQRLPPIDEEEEDDLKSKTPSPNTYSIKISKLLQKSRKTRSTSPKHIFDLNRTRTRTH